MPSFVPPKKNTAFVLYASLVSQANTKIMQANPTLAAGDVKIATDDAAPANLATLPVVDADFTKRVKVDLSAAEMNGDNVTVIFSDAAGAEWCDLTVNLQTAARQIDDLAFPATSGRSLQVEADGMAHADVKEWLGVAPLALTAQKVQTKDADAAQAVEYTAARAVKLDNLDATISSRSTYAGGAVASVTADVGITQAGADKVWATATRALTDKVGFALSAAGIQAIWDALTSALITVGSIGKLLVDNINATISSRLASASYTSPDNAGIAAVKAKTDQLVFTIANKVDASIQAAGDFAQAAADKVWASATRTLTGFGASLVAEVWNALTSGLTTVGSVGKRIADNLDVTVSSRSSHSVADVRTEMDANSVDLNTIISYVDELESRLTAVRAAKLDGLPEGIKKNQALNNFEFLMVDSADNVTPKTGLTGFTSQESIDGAAFGALSGAVSEVGNGMYKINFTAAELNGDLITFRFSAAGAAVRLITVKTSP